MSSSVGLAVRSILGLGLHVQREVGQDGHAFGAQPAPWLGGANQEKVHAIWASHYYERFGLLVDGMVHLKRVALAAEVDASKAGLAPLVGFVRNQYNTRLTDLEARISRCP